MAAEPPPAPRWLRPPADPGRLLAHPRRYLGRLGDELLPRLDALGCDLLGAFRVAMRPRQVCTIIGAREWTGLAELARASRTDPAVSAWDRYKADVVQQAEEMVLLPARHGPLHRRPR